MEPARCEICRKPVVSWLNVCGKLNVCCDCAEKLNISDLVTLGVAIEEPLPEIEAEKIAVIPHENISKARVKAYIEAYNASFNWSIDEICDRIRKLGFTTEDAFFNYCVSLYDAGYTQYSNYTLLLRERYCEQTVCDECGIAYRNALEGETVDDALARCYKEEAEISAKFLKKEAENCN